ncbi:hypothetical protein K9M16_00850 [Candidatus Babeliales bacterium]|nr:hypothetical protein [Candidatus Babeliales bacterium]
MFNFSFFKKLFFVFFCCHCFQQINAMEDQEVASLDPFDFLAISRELDSVSESNDDPDAQLIDFNCEVFEVSSSYDSINLMDLDDHILFKIFSSIEVKRCIVCLRLVCKRFKILISFLPLDTHNLTSKYYDLQDKHIRIFTEIFKATENINLLNCFLLTNRGLKNLSLLCRNIKVLNISGCFKVTNDFLLFISEQNSEGEIINLPNLESIDFSRCSHFNDAGLIPFFQVHKKLKFIAIAWCQHITNATVIALANNCSELEFLDITWCKNVTSNTIACMAGKCKKLQKIDLSGCCVADCSINSFADNCPELRQITLFCCEFGLVGIGHSIHRLKEKIPHITIKPNIS